MTEKVKAAVEERLKKELPPEGKAKCFSVTFNKGKDQNEWHAEAEVVGVVPDFPVDLMSVTGIRIVRNPDSQAIQVDVSGAKSRRTNQSK